MKRLERLTALLSYLQSRKYTKLVDLVDKFEVSERTIFRDINALEEAGVPISFEKDRGYYILDRHFLPPLAFTLDEAKSFIFVEQLAKKYTDEETFKHFSNALEKIKNKLKDGQLEDIETLQSKVKAYIDAEFLPKYLSLAENACSKKQVLKISYNDVLGNKTERVIEPIGITFYGQTWHLIAFCRLRNDYRDFSLIRIIEAQTMQETFQEERITLNEYVKKLEDSV